ncbi:hypothetical protein CC2G_009297 [Coprinopsis cinerea AmutBmut pab1-1]|nr:hypothetical protein CC2G_009297 [Coprinopsis cinerea AmutBmut pab1-1]
MVLFFLLTPVLNPLLNSPTSPVRDRPLSGRKPAERASRREYYSDPCADSAATSTQPPRPHGQPGEKWFTEMYASLDGRDPGYFDTYIGENATIIFANSPPIIGKDAIRRFINWEYTATKKILRKVHRVVVVKDMTISQGEVVYTFQEGDEITVQVVVIAEKAPEVGITKCVLKYCSRQC